MNKDLKNDYKKSIDTIRDILNAIDPEALQPGQEDGTPVDEYDQEVILIFNFLIHNLEEIKLNKNLLTDHICKIWMDNFGSSCNFANELTNQIIKKLF